MKVENETDTRAKLTNDQQSGLLSKLSWRSDEYEIDPLRGPHGGAPDARWIIRVALGKRQVILRQPTRGHIQLDTGQRGRGARPSTQTSDPSKAIEFAEEWLASERDDALFDAGIQATVDRVKDKLTIRDVCRLVWRTDLPQMRSWRRYELAGRVAEATLGPHSHVRRLDMDKLGPAIKMRMAGLPECNLGPVCVVTAVANFKDFSTILNRVGALKNSNDERLFPNPLAGMRWPTELSVTTGRRPQNVRVVKRKRDPFTLEQIEMLLNPYVHTDANDQEVVLPPPVDVADPTGALRLIVMIAFFTGRRFEAILQLRVEDLIFDRARMREVLEGADEESRRHWADRFEHGLIDFHAEWDKQGYHWPVPICELLYDELVLYLEERALTAGPLFPAEHDPSKPLAQSTMSKFPWTDPKTGRVKIGRFDRAWRVARGYLEAAGQNPDDRMPIRKGYKMQRIRAFFATHMERLGYGRANWGEEDGHSFDDHVNYIGGWAMDHSVKHARYIPLDPDVLVGVIEWNKAEAVLRNRASLQREDAARAKERIAAGLRTRRGIDAVDSVA